MKRLALALCLGALPLAFAPVAQAQPAPATLPGQGTVVAVQDFTGNGSDGYLQGVAGVVRGSLVARGSSVATRTDLNEAIGVSPPTSVLDLARRIGQAHMTHLLQGEVRPLSGQYTLSLTLIEGGTGRSARQERIVHEDDAGPTIASMLDALFAPNAMSPPPEDPADRARAEAEARRLAEEAAARARAEEEARRRAEEAQRLARQRATAETPARRFDERGPLSVGVGLLFGGRVSDGRAAPTNLLSPTAPSDPATFAMLLRAEVAYSIRAVPGLEVLGALGVMTSPTTAFQVGGGAQFTFPASARLPLRGTAGVALGLFQGASGARATTVWINPYLRAEYTFGASPWSAFAGLSADIAPADEGGVTTVSALLGARFRINP